MPLLNRELFIDAAVAQPAVIADSLYYLQRRGDNVAVAKFRAKPNRESAGAVLDALGDYVKAGGQFGKGLRPWDINAKIFDALDRTQPWWGWEFETGWKSPADRSTAVAHAWDNYDGVMFDGEGEGHYPVEITFTPAEAYRHFDGTAPARQFIDWVGKNKKLVHNGGTNNVGTHLNMSHPLFTSAAVVSRTTRFLNRTLVATLRTKGHNLQLFGRELIYGGFYEQTSNGGKNNWTEFKGFRTAYDITTFDRFLSTAAGLQKVVDAFLALTPKQQEEANRDGLGCVNLFDVVTAGAELKIAAVKANAGYNFDGETRYCARGHLGNL